jgi:hypothetical protein
MTEQPIIIVDRDEIVNRYGLKLLRARSVIRYAKERQLHEYIPIIRKNRDRVTQVVFVRADLYKAALGGDEYAIAKLLYYWFKLNMGRYRVNNNGTYKFTYLEMRRVLHDVFRIDLLRYGRGYPAKFARVVGHLIHFIENDKDMKNTNVVRRISSGRNRGALILYTKHHNNHGGDGNGM